MTDKTNPNLYDLACSLLIEFHEHTIHRIPDLYSSLLALTADTSESDWSGKGCDDDSMSTLPIDLETLRASHSIAQTNLMQFVSRINQQYKEELDRINRVDNEISDEIVKKLRVQSQYRPITITEVNVLVLSVHKKVKKFPLIFELIVRGIFLSSYPCLPAVRPSPLDPPHEIHRVDGERNRRRPPHPRPAKERKAHSPPAAQRRARGVRPGGSPGGQRRRQRGVRVRGLPVETASGAVAAAIAAASRGRARLGGQVLRRQLGLRCGGGAGGEPLVCQLSPARAFGPRTGSVAPPARPPGQRDGESGLIRSFQCYY